MSGPIHSLDKRKISRKDVSKVKDDDFRTYLPHNHYLFSEGRGKQTYVNKDIYEGEWKEGKMHGLVCS